MACAPLLALYCGTVNATSTSHGSLTFVWFLTDSLPCCFQGYFLAYKMAPDGEITSRVALGAAVQLLGFCNVVYADTTLIYLRKPGEQGIGRDHVEFELCL